jgi:lysozyme family protein
MEDRFGSCLAFTLRQEGGHVDDPADPGGATNMGITLATYRIWRPARLLQQALGFKGDQADGSIGPETLATADRFDARTLLNYLADRQTLFNFRIFGTGWLRRTNARRNAALAMIQSEMTATVAA